ncbi:src like adaptor 1a [Kryptolebias marmoratus]|uniref:Src like adaptor 1a n=1 Tax=Kryptolebias marmoratus TaxID=37003 RepID=A0A3Q3EN99_KRYMA|nr:src like adaptor 1a [Kryptolebias marmoratus]
MNFSTTLDATSGKLQSLWAGVRSPREMGNVIRGVGAGNKGNSENCDCALKDSEGSDEDIVVVLDDYPSAEISEPIYRMGDKLLVIAQEAYWWRVRSGGKENYIPNTHVAKVYHGWLFAGVGRLKAEELLLLPGNKVGSFLVRESSSERGLYSLSVRHRQIKHYRIYRLDNSWYYISPGLTFQCLEDMINHYSDTADGLCCTLTTPCLSEKARTTGAAPEPPPVVMRRNFDWKKVDRKQLVSTDSHSDSVVSYGVRNSIAAYLSFSGHENPAQLQAELRKKKSKSVYAIPENVNANSEFDEDF